MPTFGTYDQVGLAEDVSDVITDITPTDTPMYTMIKPQKVSARVYEYQEDSLASAADNKAVEGADPSMATLTATTMRTGNTQILTKAFQVSATADAVRTYGRAKETAYQLGKALKELKRDIEFAYVGQDNSAVTGDSSTAREMDSATQLIAAGNTVDAGANATDALTEAKILDAHQAAYTAGADVSVFMIKPADSEIVAGFTGSSGRTRNFNDGTTTLTNAVDVLINPYGTLKVVLNRHQLTTHAFLLDPSMWRSAVLRPVSRTLLSKTGDSDKHFVVYEGGLMHLNHSGSAMITGLS
jgi:hypothetical protein